MNIASFCQAAFKQLAKEPDSKLLNLPRLLLLLSLTPFILNLSLFNIGAAPVFPSEYLIDPLRFDSQSYADFEAYNGKAPSPPRVKIKPELKRFINQFAKMSPERFCVDTKRRPIFKLQLHFVKPELDRACSQYRRDLQIFKQKLKRRNQLIKQNKRVLSDLQVQADSFLSAAHSKPKPPEASVIAQSQGYFQALFSQFSLQSELSERQSPASKLVSMAKSLSLLLIVPALAVCLWYRAWLLLVVGLSVSSVNALAWFDATVLGGSAAGLYKVDVLLLAQISFAYFILSSHLRSEAFVSYCVLMSFFLLYLLPPHISGNETELGSFTYVIPIIIFILLSLFGRVLVKGAKQNSRLLRELGIKRTSLAIARSLLVWTPMAALCLPFFYLTLHLIPKEVTNNLHGEGLLKYDYSHNRGLLDNSLLSTAHLADDIHYVWHMAVEEQKASFHASNQRLQEANFTDIVNRRFEQLAPTRLVFDKSQSDAFIVGPVVDLANDEMKGSMQGAYSRLRSQIKSALLNIAKEKEKEIKETANSNVSLAIDKVDALYLDGQQRIQEVNSTTQAGIFASFNYLQAYHQLAMLLFAYLCLKSYLYVFSRVSINQQTGIFVSLGSKKKQEYRDEAAEAERQSFTEHSPNIRAHGSEIILLPEMADTFYLSRKFQCRGKAPKLRFIQVLSAPIARIFNGAYAMNEVNLNSKDCDVGCSSTQGIEYFEWDLRAGESVVFDYHNFVGISKGLKLSTLVSPRITSLLIGKIIYSQATGPGKLILMAKGRAQIYSGDVSTASLPPQRMLAMSVDTLLCVESELDMLNVYFSDAYIKPIRGDMIIDVDTQNTKRSGLGAFIKHFILPG